jgi:hypothetical protein
MIRAVAFIALAAPAFADEQPKCGPRESQTAFLTEKFGESQIGRGLAMEGLVEMWANPETGTWTVTVTAPDGTMCGVAAGLMFEAVPLPPQGEPA